MPNIYSGRVSVRRHIPLVVSPRGTLSNWAFESGSWFKKPFWRLLQQPALRETTCFHATAESEYQDIRRMGFRQPVAIIPNGIDMPRILTKEVQRFRTLLFLGRIHPIKGLDKLLSAWRAVQHRFPDWQIRIVGPDNRGHLGEMRRLAGELGLTRIEFEGPLFGQQKWQAYQDAEVFVLPTYSENFGIAVAEALASGLPAIVSKGAPWPGLASYRAGWWIDIGVDPLVACLEEVLSLSKPTLKEMGENGRQWMAREYSWQHIGWKMSETYRWVLEGGTKPEWVEEH